MGDYLGVAISSDVNCLNQATYQDYLGVAISSDVNCLNQATYQDYLGLSSDVNCLKHVKKIGIRLVQSPWLT